jgi:hypothetical protein
MQQSPHPGNDPGNDPANEAQRAFKNKQFKIKFKSDLTTFVSEDELWTIIS